MSDIQLVTMLLRHILEITFYCSSTLSILQERLGSLENKASSGFLNPFKSFAISLSQYFRDSLKKLAVLINLETHFLFVFGFQDYTD